MKKIVVIGDVLIEHQYFKEDYLYSPIGGAGNLAYSLAIANPNNHIILVVPYYKELTKTLKNKWPENLEIKDMFIKWPKLYKYGERIRYNRSETEKMDYPIKDWDNFLKEMDLNLSSLITHSDFLAIEWHYEGDLSIASILPHILTELRAKESMVPPLYLDARSPSMCPYDALNPMFWKMNKKEAKSLPKSFNYNGYKLMTLGNEGVVLEGVEENIKVSGTHHPKVYEIGCGDTFSAYFITSYLKGYDFRKCLEIANMAAGLACSIAGVVAIRPEDVIFDYSKFERGIIHC